MKLKPSLWLCLSCMIFLNLFAFTQRSYAQTDPSGLTDIPDFAFDRDGKSYSLRDLTIDNKSGVQRINPCNAGIFNIDFTDAVGTGFNNAATGAAMRAVACQVFSDLSQLIVPANNPYNGASNVNNPIVRINIGTGFGMPAGAIASGSSFYFNNIPFAFQNTIIDGEVYRTINGGIDSWQTSGIIYGAQLYHGLVQFNWNNFAPGQFHTNLNTAPGAGIIDLYQVLIHEAMHTLGFNSFTNAIGGSNLSNYRTRFETFIQSNGNSLLLNTTNCVMPSFNPAASTTGGCANTRFVGPSAGSVPVYAPNPFQQGSSLSHLDPTCAPFTQYVMQFSNSATIIRRPTQPEVNILCDIGYHTTNTYGFAPGSLGNYANTYTACGARIAGVDDIFQYNTTNIYTYGQGGPAVVINDFLSNDEDELNGGIPSGFDCLTIITGGGATTTLSATSFSYAAAPGFLGWAVLRYIPVDVNTGRRGAATYIYIRVNNSCPVTPTCNMVLDGDFENIPDAGFYSNFRITNNGNTPDLMWWNGVNWVANNWGTGYFVGCAGSIPVQPSHNGAALNQQYIALACFPGINIEGSSLPLCRPMMPGCTYTISYWAMAKDPACVVTANFAITDFPLCLPPALTNLTGLNNCDGNTFTPVLIETQAVNNIQPNWQQFNTTFVYSGTTPGNFITVYPTGNQTVLFVDDIVVTSTPTVALTVQDVSCNTTCDGAITSNVSCALTPLTYLWSNSVTAPNLEGTCEGAYTVHVTDAAGCTGEATATIGSQGNCGYTLAKTANHSSTYAGQPIQYTITVCNLSNTVQNVTLEDQLPPNFFLMTSPAGWPGFPASASVAVNPGCNDFVYIGYFTANGLCPDPDHTNNVTMDDGSQTYSADFCVSILYGCPMITYANSDCILNNTVPVTIGVHSYILDITRLNTWIYYPEYLTPPTTLDASTTGESFLLEDIDFGASTISGAVYGTTIGGTVYNKVLIDIYFTSPVSVKPPYYFLKLNFIYSTPIPPCSTSYDCWAEAPVGSTYHVDLYQPGNPNGSPAYSPWTQAAHVNFIGCDGCLRPDATFTAEVKECDEHGCVTLTGLNSSPTAIHMWEFGDNRSTPFNGAQTTTWCYLDPFTDNFGVTQPGAAPGVYTVTHTVIDNGQVGIETMQITVSGPCCKASKMIPDGTYSSSIGSGYSGIDVEIMGDFIIDNNFVFDNCVVLADPASQIIITDKGYLTIKYSDVHACSNMWKGILIEPGGVLSTFKSKISDAQYAVYAMDKSTFKIGQTDFDNNYVGVYIPPSTLGVNSISGAIYGSSFTQFTPFKPFYAGQSPLPGTVSYAGIEINDWTLVMSGSGLNTYFDNINNGIVARRCNLTITEAWFEKIYPDTYYGNLYDGSGIYAAGGRGNHTLTQTGFGASSTVQKSFRNCHIGIYTERMNASISANYMENVNTGVRFWYGRIKSAKIQKNFIDCNYFGVDLRFNDGSYGIAVASNGINLGYNSTVTNKSMAIRSNDYGTATSKISITYNKISMDRGGFGIYCSKSKAVNISSNGIWMSNPSWNYMGISQYGCDKSRVTCNSVGSAGISSNLKNQTAIYTSISPGTTIGCNNVDQTYHGIRFDGASNSSDVKTNSMNKHYYSLYYGTTAVTGAQKDKGNMWNGSAGIADAINNGVPGLSPYYVNPWLPYRPSTIIPALGWFYNSGNAPEECQQPASCSIRRTIRISKEEIALASGSFGFPSYTDETNWMTDKFLYHKLSDDPSLVSTDPSLPVFMKAMQYESMGELVSVETGIENLMTDGASLEAQIEKNSLEIEQHISSIAGNITRLQDPNLSPADEDKILKENFKLQMEIGDLQDKMTVLLDKLAQSHEADADKVAADNSNVKATKVYDENEKFVNTLYLETIARGKSGFDLKQISKLYSIASQCAFGGSDAVYNARSMYNLIDDKIDFDDFDICPNSAGGMFKVADPLSENNNVWSAPSIIPNPANDYADIYFASMKEVTRELAIFDNVGHLVKKIVINPDVDKLTIDLNGFAQGVYYVQISSSDKLSERAKLIVIR